MNEVGPAVRRDSPELCVDVPFSSSASAGLIESIGLGSLTITNSSAISSPRPVSSLGKRVNGLLEGDLSRFGADSPALESVDFIGSDCSRTMLSTPFWMYMYKLVLAKSSDQWENEKQNTHIATAGI